MAIQDIRAKAKSQVHDAFSVLCDYYVGGLGSPLQNIKVRKDEPDDVVEAGDLNSGGWATMGEQPIYLIFDANDVLPQRGDIADIAGDRYQISRPLKARRGYIKCEVIEL